MSDVTIPVGSACPCGSGRLFEACCGPYLAGSRSAATAETLMRSRYCAYVCKDEAYLSRTWHPATRPRSQQLAEQGAVKWTRLDILSTRAGGSGEHEGWVEFMAHFEHDGRAGSMREKSHFLRQDGQWFYRDGKPLPAGRSGQPGRNALCPCGSAKKYKRCCGKSAIASG